MMIWSDLYYAQSRSIEMMRARTVYDIAEHYGAARYILKAARQRVFSARHDIDECWLYGFISGAARDICESETSDLCKWISECDYELIKLMHQKVDSLQVKK